MVGACGAIWLAALGMGVVAAVAMSRLASGQADGDSRHSSWLLYTIIAISALIIAGAIPLLLRARRGAATESVREAVSGAEPQDPRRSIRPLETSTEKMRVFGVDPYTEHRIESDRPVSAVPSAVLDRLWLRGTVALLGAMGLAMIAVAAGSYLLASGSDTAAWATLGVAGVITVAMPAVLAFYQRQLADAVDDATL